MVVKGRGYKNYKNYKAVKAGIKMGGAALPFLSKRFRAAIGLASYTKSKKSIHQKAIQQGNGGSFSSFFYGKRKVPKRYRGVIKALPKNYIVLNGASRATSGVGVQAANILVSMFNQGDLAVISTAVSGGPVNKFLCMSCTAETMITNQDEGNARFTIYDIVARRDLSTATVADPRTSWATSYGDEGGANNDFTVYGSTPFSSDLFTQYFKVLKITHVILGAGAMHNHRVHYQPNRYIDGEVVQYCGYGVKGLSCFSMLVQHGTPYNDTTTKTQVSLGVTALDIVYRKQYKYTWMSDLTTSYSKTNNLVTAFTVSESVESVGLGIPIVADISA